MAEVVDITIGFGKAVLATSVTTISSFKVDKPWARVAAQISGRRRPGTCGKHNVGHPDINGALYSDTVGHEFGTILLLSSSLTRGAVAVSDGAIILRLRQGAAVLNIGAKLPAAQDNFFGQRFAMFQGPADILSVEEAELLGIRVPQGYLNKFFDPEQLEERFDVLEINPAAIPQPELQVISVSGKTQVVEVAAMPMRRMNLRR